MRNSLRFVVLNSLLLVSIFLIPVAGHAQWQTDGAAVGVAPGTQTTPTIVADGSGGSIVTWFDDRSGLAHIYVQRLNAMGVAQWTAGGVLICNAIGGQSYSRIVSDGVGGAIVAWADYRGGATPDIYAQRVNAAGTPLWTADGVAVCTAANFQTLPVLATDGAGGAIIAWPDLRSGTNYDAYAQRINSSGVVQWTANGVVISNAAGDQNAEQIMTDGAGGAFITWGDSRAGNTDIYAQRVNGSGVAQWVANGVVVCATTGIQQAPQLASDSGNGVIIAWEDLRGSAYDIYAQHLNAAGIAQWTANGVVLCAAAGDQLNPMLASDGAGGAIVTWQDGRGAFWTIFAARVNSLGAVPWTVDGVQVANIASTNFYSPVIIADGAGGALVSFYGPDLYVQRIGSNGSMLWTINGVNICPAAGTQFSPQIVNDGFRGAVLAWYDNRSGASDIYAQRVDMTYGFWGHPEPVVTSVADVRKDQGGRVALNWTASSRDLMYSQAGTIGYYSIWRATNAAPFAASSPSSAVISIDKVRADTKPGTLMAASGYYWELVGTQQAARWSAYTFSAPTRADSVLGSTATEYFMVAAHDVNDNQIAFASNTVSGHSVDNLAPAAPLSLIAQRVGNYVHLRWNHVHVVDLRNYAVYRKTSSGVTPVPVNFLSDASDTLLTDTMPPASAIYYIVTAYDRHDNQSAPSNEASVGPTTGAGNLPPITSLMVLQNRPNPFGSSSTFELGLPKASKVELEVFDVAGRRVADRSFASEPAGWNELTLDGTGEAGAPLASGVYFYRIHAAGQTITRKMVIAR